jgi:hypothetical protein
LDHLKNQSLQALPALLAFPALVLSSATAPMAPLVSEKKTAPWEFWPEPLFLPEPLVLKVPLHSVAEAELTELAVAVLFPPSLLPWQLLAALLALPPLLVILLLLPLPVLRPAGVSSSFSTTIPILLMP